MRIDKPSRWFRMYAEFAHDPKVQMLSEVDQRRFLMLLCMRCGNGDVTLHDVDVTFVLRISDAEWTTTRAALLSKNLIDNDNKPTAWEKRQYRSDSSAERVSKHRALHKQQSNGDVTLQQRPVEGEAEREGKPPKPPKGGDTRFGRFWESYPRKQGKGAAEKAWGKARINGEFDSVLTALEAQKCSEQWRKDNGQFIPNPATWINQRRWEDEIPGGSHPDGTSPMHTVFAGAL